jgi:hypothetical protein
MAPTEHVRPVLQGDPREVASWALDALAASYGLNQSELAIVVAGLAEVAIEARDQFAQSAGEQRCSVCGCSNSQACPGGCIWATDTLCSRCV